MGIQLAHIEEQLKPIADHESRIRGLEKAVQENNGGRDLISRWTAYAAVAVAAASGLAAWLAAAHH